MPTYQADCACRLAREFLGDAQRRVGEDEAELRLAFVHAVGDFAEQADHGQRVEARVIVDARFAEADRRIDQRHHQLAGVGVGGGDGAGLIEKRGRRLAADRHRLGHFPRQRIVKGGVERFDDVEGVAAVAACGDMLLDRFRGHRWRRGVMRRQTARLRCSDS